MYRCTEPTDTEDEDGVTEEVELGANTGILLKEDRSTNPPLDR